MCLNFKNVMMFQKFGAAKERIMGYPPGIVRSRFYVEQFVRDLFQTAR